jgi:hypothetical protein
MRDVGQDLIDEVRGEIGHAPAAARRAEAAALAGERDELVGLAARAPHARETEGEEAAGEVALELGSHETGQAVMSEEEGREMLAQDPVQGAALRLAALSLSAAAFPGGHAGGRPTKRAAVSGRERYCGTGPGG